VQCERCNKNEAKIHLIKLINGRKTETWLCEKCAKELSDIPVKVSMTEGEGLPLQNILSGFFETLDKKKKIEIVCKNCGLTYSQFKNNGQLGCSKCYESFEDFLRPRIKRIQGDLEHIGKIPVREGNEFVQRKRIKKIKEELQKAVIKEEYERAAVLRDEIKSLESLMEVNIDNEELDR
jgi:protein arginine kinase activator